MGSMFQSSAPAATPGPAPFRVLVIGGSYGGLSAALNLQDLCHGRAPRCGPAFTEEEERVERPHTDVEITIVDERDGFCENQSHC